MHSYFKYAFMLNTWATNNLSEISSKYMNYLAEKFRLCAIVIASESLPRTINGQWHPLDPMEALALLSVSRDVTALELPSNSERLRSPSQRTKREVKLLAVYYHFQFWTSVPCQISAGFLLCWCVGVGFLKAKYDAGSTLSITYLFSSSTAFY